MPRGNAKNTKKQNHVLPFVYAALLTACLAAFVILLPDAGFGLKLSVFISVPALLTAGLIVYILEKLSLFRLIFSCVVVFMVFFVIYIVLRLCGVFDQIADLESLRQLILSTGNKGKLVFCLLQFLQVVILPVPSIIFFLAGIVLYGALTTFILSTITVILGSLVCFWIGRLAGKKVVEFIAGKEEARKYRKYLADKGRLPFILMMLFPFFPDDLLCMLAGATTMTFWFFLVVIIVTRTLATGVTCFLGSGDIIPFSGWGIPVWIALFLLLVAGALLYNKYKKKLNKLFSAKKKKKKSQQISAASAKPASAKSAKVQK